MKLNTAFQLSTLAVAMSFASLSNASTFNDYYWGGPDWQETVNNGWLDQADYQYVDLGSGNTLTYIAGSGISGNLPVELHNVDGKDYYRIDGKVFIAESVLDSLGNPVTQLINGKDVPVKTLIESDTVSNDDLNYTDTFVHGGTANDYKAGSFEEVSSIKRVDTNSVTYGDVTTIYEDQTQATIAVTDSVGNSDPFVGATQQGTGVKQVSDQVVLGVVNQQGDKYGVHASKIDADGNESSTVLTASGISTTGFIKAQTLDVETITSTNGLNVVGGLTTDTFTANDLATFNGLLTANNGLVVKNGLGVDNLTAKRIDTELLVSERNHVPFTVLAATELYSQTLEDGTIVLASKFENKGQTKNSLSGKYIVNGEEVYTFRTFEGENEVVHYYKKDASGNFNPIAEVEAIKNGTIAPEKGGVTANTVGVSSQSTIQNIITDNLLRYSEETTTQEAVDIKGALTPLNAGSGVEQFDQPMGYGEKTKTLHLVDTGIIDKDTNGNNVYGVVAKRVDANGEAKTTLTADGITTNGTINTQKLVVDGRDLGAELTSLDGRVTTVEGDVTQLKTDVTNLDQKVTDEVARLDGEIATVNGRVDAVETSVANLDAKVDSEVARLDADVAAVNGRVDAVETSVANLDAKVDSEVARLDADLADVNGRVDAVETSVADVNGRVDAVETSVANLDATITAGDEATLAAANTNTANTAQTLRQEAAAESARVDTVIATGDAATLTAAKAEDAKTLKAAQDFAKSEDAKTLAAANDYTDAAVAGFNTRVGQLNSRIDDVEKTAYRGIAIALAAQQQIPNIGAGQTAVFGGVGHYEGESAAALGLATVFADGRTSLSAALGVAGGSEVGGRVGVAYVFGGK